MSVFLHLQHLLSAFNQPSSSPSNLTECGFAESRSSVACSGYHCFSQFSTVGGSLEKVSEDVLCCVLPCTIDRRRFSCKCNNCKALTAGVSAEASAARPAGAGALPKTGLLHGGGSAVTMQISLCTLATVKVALIWTHLPELIWPRCCRLDCLGVISTLPVWNGAAEHAKGKSFPTCASQSRL